MFSISLYEELLAHIKLSLHFLTKEASIRAFKSQEEINISDGETYFTNSQFGCLLNKYGVNYWISIPYHPHINGEVKASNREIKNINKNL